MRRLIASVLVICALQVDVTSGLKCYACVQNGIKGDRRCELSAKDVPNGVVNCNKKYCVIRRIEYVDQGGAVFSFYRGCEQSPDFINSEVTDSQFKTYFRSCTTDRCNDGNGISNGGSGGGFGDDGAVGRPLLTRAQRTLAAAHSAQHIPIARLLEPRGERRARHPHAQPFHTRERRSWTVTTTPSSPPHRPHHVGGAPGPRKPPARLHDRPAAGGHHHRLTPRTLASCLGAR
ncbi:Hypothetical predicted protein [Cloeon dipterum]|uniref:UPAR/Ly6 domain-containing protein n=1 Tax=Cloeon dipterum TaxID=197152 RepID=A0A8S1DDS0_9INSE|nr:Hypothetical predicted protein [Cloeon dipterum]